MALCSWFYKLCTPVLLSTQIILSPIYELHWVINDRVGKCASTTNTHYTPIHVGPQAHCTPPQSIITHKDTGSTLQQLSPGASLPLLNHETHRMCPQGHSLAFKLSCECICNAPHSCPRALMILV